MGIVNNIINVTGIERIIGLGTPWCFTENFLKAMESFDQVSLGLVVVINIIHYSLMLPLYSAFSSTQNPTTLNDDRLD